MSIPQDYVLGFMFSEDRKIVALIKKKSPGVALLATSSLSTINIYQEEK